jgi:hypothetical protein
LEEIGALMTRVVTPDALPIEREIEYGRLTKMSVRSTVRGTESGSHMNMARVA